MTSDMFHESKLLTNSSKMELVHLVPNWEDVVCPICLDFPHNGVLLQCTSYERGCRPLMCDTDYTHSNCLDRFKTAFGEPTTSSDPSTSEETVHRMEFKGNERPTCPLCRGEVTGWVVIDDIRLYLNEKLRHCEQEKCTFKGNYFELQNHSKLEHPDARPLKIDPAQQLDWENFQQSSEIIDVLSTIHSEVPHVVILGDYVIEYGEDETRDEFDDYPRPRGRGNWWTSCILYKVFDNCRTSRSQRRSRVSQTRRGHRRSSFDSSNSDEGSRTSVEIGEYRADETDYEFTTGPDPSIEGSIHRRFQRRHSRFYDH